MQISHKRGLQAGLMSALLAASTAQAFEGDAQRGRVLAETCLGCHGVPSYTNTYPTYHVPKVGGQNEAYIISALLDYRSGKRAHSIMHKNAKSLSDQDIADIAVYFSTAVE